MVDIFRYCQHLCKRLCKARKPDLQNLSFHFANHRFWDQSLFSLATTKASVSALETGMRTQYVIKLHFFSYYEDLFWYVPLKKKKRLMSIDDQSRWKRENLLQWQRQNVKNIPMGTLWVLDNLGHQRVSLKPCDPAENPMTPIIRL